MRRRWIVLISGAAVAGSVALAIAIGPRIEPVAYAPEQPPPMSGPFEKNLSLRHAALIGSGELAGPEDVAIDARGRVYCGLTDGTVRRSRNAAGAGPFEIFASTGGRPHGLDFDATGLLWVADTQRGLLSIDTAGEVELRTNSADGLPVAFANDVTVGPDGTVYFSDASSRYGPGQLMLEALEGKPHGRVVAFDRASGRARTLLDGLYFANGVAVAADGSFLLVAETFRYRIRRLWLAGPEQGQSEILIDNLPGFPDGVARDADGIFWIALHGLRSGVLDRMLHPRPWLKRWVASLPRRLQSSGRPYGLVLAVDGNGRVLRSLHDPGGERISHVTSVEPHGGFLWLGTVEGKSVGRLALTR